MEITTVNPATGLSLEKFHRLSLAEAGAQLDGAWRDFIKWRETSVQARASAVHSWAQALKSRREELARQMSLEMGKPITQALGEIDKSTAALEFLAEEGPEWISSKRVIMPKGGAEISYEPIGPVLAIMPWNFPLWQVVRFAGPALIVGNPILLKHSDQTAGCARLIAESAKGLAGDLTLIRNCQINHETAARLMEHPHLRGVTFTGSTRGGRQVAEAAARNLKKTVLELGGSDPYLVMADAEVPRAAEVCAAARMVNGGQSCVAAKRFIVERAAAPLFLENFVREMRSYQPGPPLETGTRLGPMAAKKFQAQLAEQVADLKNRGGEILCGGETPVGPGAYYPPTVVLFSRPQAGLGDIEIFGPVATVILVDSEDEAVRVANDSIYGLGAAVFSGDPARAKRMASRLEAGFVGINDQVRSDVRVPFGGVKQSGWGRELSFHGIYEFCNIQSRTWPS